MSLMDGLDPVDAAARSGVAFYARKASENKTTILISSHNLRELEDVCDHVGIMHKGRIIVERSLRSSGKCIQNPGRISGRYADPSTGF